MDKSVREFDFASLPLADSNLFYVIQGTSSGDRKVQYADLTQDSGVSAGTYGDATHVGQFVVNVKGHVTSASNVPISGLTITEANLSLSDVTTDDASTAKHGFLKKLPNDATKFLDGQGNFSAPPTPTITEANLSLSDVTTDNVTSAKHGFAPKSPGDAGQFLNGGATPGFAAVTDINLSTSDVTNNNVSTSKHGFTPKLPGSSIVYLDGTGAFTSPSGTGGAGDVNGPASAVSGNLAIFDGTSGKLIKDGGAPSSIGVTTARIFLLGG